MMVAVEPTPLLATLLEATRAVRVARLPVPVRCGASTGEVILLEGDDYIGNTVNLAARLCDLADGGQILASLAIVEHLPRWATVLSVEDMVVRGIGEAVPVARVGFATLEPPVRPDPICGIPLSRDVAEEQLHDAYGNEVWLCSDSCRDTWEHRPRPIAEGQGSLRTRSSAPDQAAAMPAGRFSPGRPGPPATPGIAPAVRPGPVPRGGWHRADKPRRPPRPGSRSQNSHRGRPGSPGGR